MIRYPAPLQKGGVIGICAPSSGVSGVFAGKMDYAISKLEGMGYDFVETASVRKQKKLTSATGEIRAAEFTSLYLDESVGAIIPPWGGEFLMDILPFLDFDELAKAKPKWVMGFSDISTLLFTLTIKLNIATAHGPNLLDFGATTVHHSVLNSLDILSLERGAEIIQKSLDRYQKEWFEVSEDNFPPYNMTEEVEWKVLGTTYNKQGIANDQGVEISGRLIGGNLDVICKLIGTPFDLTREFVSNYKDEGLIWYLESCEMNSTDIYRTLWQMKYNGWFENCHGVLMGRPEGYNDVADFTYIDALEYGLADLAIPVIYDVDLGHLPPQLTFINGAYADVRVRTGKSSVKQILI